MHMLGAGRILGRKEKQSFPGTCSDAVYDLVRVGKHTRDNHIKKYIIQTKGNSVKAEYKIAEQRDLI